MTSVGPLEVPHAGFFFQAEDGIRDHCVTGVQTCALPISDWEKELADFYHTDVDVPAKLTVDGKTYPDVGVHFRGASSYMTVPEGGKRSLDISMHFVHAEQRLGGYRSLNLLNSNADPTFLRT